MMKHLLSLYVLAGLLIFLGSGCKKEDDEERETPSEVIDKYYVKYEVNSSTIYLGGKLEVTLNNEKNQPLVLKIDQRKLSESVIGPVEKGFNASLKVVALGNTFDKLKLYTKIYISKNDSPFAIKIIDDNDAPRDSVLLNYTVE